MAKIGSSTARSSGRREPTRHSTCGLGRAPIHEAAMAKVFASELQERLGQAALDILGSGGLLSEDAEGAPLGEMEQLLRHSLMGIIAGGTNEIQRSIIAQRGLGLPR